MRFAIIIDNETVLLDNALHSYEYYEEIRHLKVFDTRGNEWRFDGDRAEQVRDRLIECIQNFI